MSVRKRTASAPIKVVEGKYNVIRIYQAKWDCEDPDYEEKKRDGFVLRDDFFHDNKMAFATEWLGFPGKQNYTVEPLHHIYPDLVARRALMLKMQEEWGKGGVKKEPKKEENRDADDLTEEEKKHVAAWQEFAKKYSKKVTFISAVADITPLAAEFTDRSELVVRVRVAQLTENFRRKVVNGRRIDSKFPVTWKNALMFVTMGYDDLAEIYPDCQVFRIFDD